MSNDSKFLNLVNKVFGTSYGNEEDAQKHIDENGLPKLEAEKTAPEEPVVETEEVGNVEAEKTETPETPETPEAPVVETEKTETPNAIDEAFKSDFQKFQDSTNKAIGDLTALVKSLVEDKKESDLKKSNEISQQQKDINALKSMMNDRKSLSSGKQETTQAPKVIEGKEEEVKEGATKSAGGFLSDHLGGKIVKQK